MLCAVCNVTFTRKVILKTPATGAPVPAATGWRLFYPCRCRCPYHAYWVPVCEGHQPADLELAA